MRLSSDGFTPEMLRQVMGVLFVTQVIPSPANEQTRPLLCFAEESIEEQRQCMPVFDEWGIVPAGHRGPRPNPWAAEPECMGEFPEPAKKSYSQQKNFPSKIKKKIKKKGKKFRGACAKDAPQNYWAGFEILNPAQ